MRWIALVGFLIPLGVAPRAQADERHGHWHLSLGLMDTHLFHSGNQYHHVDTFTTLDLRYGKHWTENLAWIVGGGFDWAPRNRRFGMSASFTLEWRTHDRIRFDVNFVAMVDRGEDLEVFAGVGPGVTFFLTKSKRWLLELSLPWLVCLKSPSGFLFAPSIGVAYRW